MSDRLAPILRRLALAVGWLAAAVAIALGGAGVVAGIDHPAGAARPELTYAMDRVVGPELDRSLGELSGITDQVDELGSLGRGALAAIVARDAEQVNRFVADGTTLVAAIGSRAAALRRTLQEMPGFGRGEELVVGAPLRARHAALVDALAETEALGAAWGVLADAGLTATRLSGLLEAHDAAVLAATAAARKLDYAGAVKQVQTAAARLGEARAVRDTMRNTTDTTTLDELLARDEGYDKALLALYTAFRDSKGRVTNEVRAAIKAEQEARDRLPADGRPVTVILAEIARGGATEAAIDIESARGALAAAVAAMTPGEATPAP